MIELSKGGAYLVDGVDVIEESAAQQGALAARLGTDAPSKNKNNSARNGTNCSSVRCFILYTTRKHMVKLHKNAVHNYCRLYIEPLAFCAGILYYTSKKQRRFGIADPLLPRRILFFN